jgi:putative GTP pyrophosphokinase
VNTAGDSLLRQLHSIKGWNEYVEAFDVLSNWRASHNYPLNTFQANIRTKIRRSGYNDAIVAQRLKRASSIVAKLSREPNMRLSTMQDIGGIRAILPALSQVLELADSFRSSRFHHELIREYDYIAQPKESGYRSVHFVYRYKNAKRPEFNGLRIEVQIRNQLQHSWATAVEVLGAFLNAPLKSSEGPDRWLKFFAMVGSGFALLENCKPNQRFAQLEKPALLDMICFLEDELGVASKLETFGATLHSISFDQHDFKYYLLHVRPATGLVDYMGFQQEDLGFAIEQYQEKEQLIKDRTDEQVVLVSGVTFQELQRAYPNYFLDTKLFLKNLALLKDFLD